MITLSTIPSMGLRTGPLSPFLARKGDEIRFGGHPQTPSKGAPRGMN